MEILPYSSKTHHSLNFVDENNVLVGYDYESSCCEDFFYTITESNEFITPIKYDYLSNDNVLMSKTFNRENIEEFDLTEYVFDTEYCRAVDNDYDGNEVVFKLVKSKCKNLYLHLINCHNGYYAHGFTMVKDDVKLHEGYL